MANVPKGIAIDPQTCRMCRPPLLRPPRAPSQEQLYSTSSSRVQNASALGVGISQIRPKAGGVESAVSWRVPAAQLNDRILAWLLHLVTHRARLVDRFLDWMVKKGALGNNPLADLRIEYGQRSTTPVVRTLLNPDFGSVGSNQSAVALASEVCKKVRVSARSLCRKVILSAHPLARGLVVGSAPLDLATLPISSAGPPLHHAPIGAVACLGPNRGQDHNQCRQLGMDD